ncbi:MAG TPA: hypothetical protein PK264_09620 [Hyphomicrobiaceae bacterium]|nr:hypothetical protein [Hyphomicrobiaceae bacterium]
MRLVDALLSSLGAIRAHALRSVLTMLDARGGGSGAAIGMHEDGQSDYSSGSPGSSGSSFGATSSSPPRRSPGAGSGSSSRPVDKKLDDEIPF